MAPLRSKCLICDIKVEPTSSKETESGNDASSAEDFLREQEVVSSSGGSGCPNEIKKSLSQTQKRIEKQLHIIFILRNVLELPKETLEKYLKLHGNPEDWIILCERCSEVIENIKGIFVELQKISSTYEKAKELVQEKIKTLSIETGRILEGLDVYQDCRSIVSKRNRRSSTVYDSTERVEWDQVAFQIACKAVVTPVTVHGNATDGVPVNIEGVNNGEPCEILRTDKAAPKNTNCEEVGSFQDGSIVVGGFGDDNCSESNPRTPVKIDFDQDETSAPHSPATGFDDDYQSDQNEYEESVVNSDDNEGGANVKYLLRRSKRPRRCSNETPARDKLKSKGMGVKGQEDPMEIDSENEDASAPNSPAADSDEDFQLDVREKSDLKKDKSFVSENSSDDDNEATDANYQLRGRRCSNLKSSSRSRSKQRSKTELEDDSTLSLCDHCDEQCSDPTTLREHKLSNHADLDEDDNRTCNICKRFFRTKKHLNRHLKDVGGHKKHKCHLCGKQEISELYLKRHHKNDHEISLHQCTFEGCSRSFQLARGLKKHMQEHEEKGTLAEICNLCGRTLSSRKGLLEHQFIVHKVGKPPRLKFFECKDCGHRSFEKGAESIHRRVCPKKTIFECDICPVQFRSQMELSIHMEVRHSIKSGEAPDVIQDEKEEPEIEDRYPCTLCGKLFFSKKTLFSHEKWVHLNSKAFTCDVPSCKFGTSRQSTLVAHKALKHQIGIEAFRCDKCQHICKSMPERRRHICGVPEKANKKKIICKLCGKEFTLLVNLQSHMAHMHERKFEFKCHLCDRFKGAFHKAILESHLARMHSIGDWKCEEEGCTKVFHRKKFLEEHVRYTHKGEERPKNAICSTCGKGFTASKLLKRHFQTVHSKIKAYQCEWCGDTFRSSYARYKHKIKCPDRKQE